MSDFSDNRLDDELPPHPGCGDANCMMDHDWYPGTMREQADALIAKRRAEALAGSSLRVWVIDHIDKGDYFGSDDLADDILNIVSQHIATDVRVREAAAGRFDIDRGKRGTFLTEDEALDAVTAIAKALREQG
jgi:hypothetical protein